MAAFLRARWAACSTLRMATSYSAPSGTTSICFASSKGPTKNRQRRRRGKCLPRYENYMLDSEFVLVFNKKHANDPSHLTRLCMIKNYVQGRTLSIK